MPKPGQPGPAFTLANQDGVDVSSAALVARGPLVISFFRGRW
jgi:peroxiredoxin